MKTTKIYSIALAVILLLTFAACTPEGKTNDLTATPQQTENSTPTSDNGDNETLPTPDAPVSELTNLIGKWTYTHTTDTNDALFVPHEFTFVNPYIEISAESMAMGSWDGTDLVGNIKIALYAGFFVGTISPSSHSYIITDIANAGEGGLTYPDRTDLLQYNPDDATIQYNISGTDVYHHFASRMPSGETISISPYEGHDPIAYSVNDTELSLMYVDLTNEDIVFLKRMTNLTSLILSGTGISDISPLKDLINLRVLDLNYNKINDFDVLKGLTNLTGLYLSDTGINNLDVLKGLTNLERLSLERNPLTQKQIDKLQGALPNCTIYYDKAEG